VPVCWLAPDLKYVGNSLVPVYWSALLIFSGLMFVGISGASLLVSSVDILLFNVCW
jgi:hypothetical protein